MERREQCAQKTVRNPTYTFTVIIVPLRSRIRSGSSPQNKRPESRVILGAAKKPCVVVYMRVCANLVAFYVPFSAIVTDFAMERLPDSLQLSCPESRICFKVETVTRTERASEGKSKISSLTGHTNGVAPQSEHPQLCANASIRQCRDCLVLT
jgi:hypothetical protein